MTTTTLLLRLAGPMQSWGTMSRFGARDTGLEPSKSGVIGLLCAALGRPREAPVDDLATLLMGVRVDHEGVVQVDYQTAGGDQSGRMDESSESSGSGGWGGAQRRIRYGVAEFSGGDVRTVISRRAYLADAAFLVALEAASAEQERLLSQLDAALARPVWPLFLGRKTFVPGDPIRLPDQPPLGPGLVPLSMREALLAYPWPSGAHTPATSALRFVFEDPTGASSESRRDTPISFAPLDRRYTPRSVRTEMLTRPATTSIRPSLLDGGSMP